MFLLESLVLGVFGAVAGAVVAAMAAGVLNFTNIQLPLSVQLFLMSDTLQLSVIPSALGGAIALITVVTGAHSWAHRASPTRAPARVGLGRARW